MNRLLVPVLCALTLFPALPSAAQDTATDCDRLAGYDHTPRRPGLPGVYAVLDPPAAIAACEAALAAPGADPFLNFLLARALLAANPDDPRAVALVEAGRPASGTMADSRLGLFHDDGLAGLPRDRARGLELATQACAAWPDRMARAGCNNMARSQIEDFPEFRAEGVALMRQMCDTGLAVSCKNMGVYLHDGEVAEPDFPQSLAFFDRGCDLGEGDACGWAGYMREHGEGTGIDLVAAFQLYLRGCELGDPWSCYAQGENLADGLGVARDWEAGLVLLERACAMGEEEGCFALAEKRLYGMDRSGPTTPEGQAAALGYFQTACAGGSGRACLELSGVHRDGIAVPPDPEAAARFRRMACDLGEAEACAAD